MRPKIALIYNEPIDGLPVEEQVAFDILDGVEAVNQALDELGYPVTRIPLLPPLAQVKKKLKDFEAEAIFNLFEGFVDEPKTEPAVAELLFATGLPCTGCPPQALTLALDKVKTKTILGAEGIPVPRYQVLSPSTLSSFRLGYPCIVKPRWDDASLGLTEESVVSDFASLEKQVIKVSHRFGGRALVEEFLDGREFNVTVMGNEKAFVLPASEILYSLPAQLPRILTFSAKWAPDTVYYQGTESTCPAEIDTETLDRIAEVSLKAYHLLGCKGYARVDLRLDGDEAIKVLEVNPNPDIMPDSGAVRQARCAGMTYTEFIGEILRLALER